MYYMYLYCKYIMKCISTTYYIPEHYINIISSYPIYNNILNTQLLIFHILNTPIRINNYIIFSVIDCERLI